MTFESDFVPCAKMSSSRTVSTQ